MFSLYSVKIKPITWNNCYSQSKNGRRFLSKQGKEYKREIKRQLQGIKVSFNPESQFLSLDVSFYHDDIMTKTGKIKARRHDLDGFLKLFIDAMIEATGLPDDSYICDINCAKRPGNNLIIFNITPHLIDESFNVTRQ